MSSKHRAVELAVALSEKQGADVRLFNLREVASFTDFFVIATGTSHRHVQTLAETTVETAQRQGERPLGIEGEHPGRWVLVDLGDVVVHLFDAEAREFYALERLWGEAEQVELPPGAGAAGRAGAARGAR